MHTPTRTGRARWMAARRLTTTVRGYEVMLAGGGKEDCSGRCYKKGSADDLKKAIMGVMKYDFHTTISDEKAAYIANEMLKTGTSTAMTNGGKSITLTKEKAHD